MKAHNFLEFMTSGDQVISPSKAEVILDKCFYDQQSRLMKTSDVHIARMANVIIRDGWIPYSQISFARLPSGELILIDGYHRLSAVVSCGQDATFNVQIRHCDNMNEVSRAYSSYDRSENARVRSKNQAANALGYSENLGLSKGVTNALTKSVTYIYNGLKPILPRDKISLIPIESPEDRLELAMQWKNEAAVFDEIYTRSHISLKRKLLTGPIFAVALVTMRHQPARSKEFWSLVAQNDGLRKGTPEHTLVQRLLEVRLENNTEEPFLIPAIAWNAFYEGRNLSIIKAGLMVALRISGTPYEKGC